MEPLMIVLDLIESLARVHVVSACDVEETDLILAGPIWNKERAWDVAIEFGATPQSATLN